MEIDKNTTLLEALEMAPETHGLFTALNETMSKTGLTKVEISEILEPYSSSILSGEGLSEDEIKEITSKLLSKI
ncbi:hypothetical protein NYE67_02705 [Solibacillus sp. FSL W8-0474]|uniref:hypothetical protein n=1 Tax=Solibacillus sp. FSL W8-0474 TaxID=2975336 RepID=UPI0030FC8441